MPHLYISAAHKSSGKTTAALGLCAALRKKGLRVQPFKKGPDYIDSIWLGMAAGRDCHNLDFHTMDRSEILSTFGYHAAGCDVSVIEGNKGLHDGVALEGEDSNAAMVDLLGAPVVLVIDTAGMTRGIAPLLLGYQAFEPRVPIAGVILNQVAGPRHEQKLRAAVERYTDIPIVGAIGRDKDMAIAERHLGLVPGNEMASAGQVIARIGGRVAGQVQVDTILTMARRAALPVFSTPLGAPLLGEADVRLGVMRDAAFGFYYPGDLEALRAAGAELVFINALEDSVLPDLDGLFIGGGFPEIHSAALEANQSLRQQIHDAIDRGLPVYAECGGLMYLARSIAWNGQNHRMVGSLDIDVVMHDHPRGRGYVCLQETGKGPWPLESADGTSAIFNAHEFHYSTLVNFRKEYSYAYRVLRGFGIDGANDGIIYRNMLASFCHLRDVNANHWTQRFVAFVRSVKSSLKFAASL